MTPTTKIEVDRHTAEALANCAATLGLSIQDYLAKHFLGRQELGSLADPEKWLDELSDGLGEMTPLPPDFSTNDVYTDHD